MAIVDLTFDPATHTYRLNGEVVPSVTKIIEPTYDFRFVDPAKLEAAARLGTAVHKTIELAGIGRLDRDNTPSILLKYLEGYEAFCRDLKYTALRHEVRVVHEQLRYAGTIDIVGEMDGRPFDVDVKTGAKYPGHRLQTMGYKLARIAMGDADHNLGRGCLYLDENGDYEIVHYSKWDSHDQPAFIALATLHRWQQLHNKR